MTNQKSTTLQRIQFCFKASFPKAWKTSMWLLKIMLPVTFAVLLLDYSGLLAIIASWFEPFFEMIGLPGKSALVLLSSVFANIYSAIAVITTLGFETRSALILAVMCLISHAFIVEAAVIRKTGSNIFYMLGLRLLVSAIAGVLLNLILPEFDGYIGGEIAFETTFLAMFLAWFKSSMILIVKVIVLIVALMFLQKMLEEFGVIKYLVKILRPIMAFMGLPEETTFAWIVANTLGLGYGSAIIIDLVEEGNMSKRSVELLNNHLVISHSLLEDPLLFVAIGLPLAWLIVPRLILAIVVVWIRRLFK